MFTKNSRYAKVENATAVDARGRTVTYKQTRFIAPAPARQGHIIAEGERLDHIAHYYYKDAGRFWRICDANAALWPADLAADVGRKINIPASQA